MDIKPSTLNFELLMSERITRVLLVCSSYDQFTIDEDGRIEKQIQSEYSELSLSQPPRFTRTDNGEEALALLHSGERFDLVITMFNIGSMSPFEFSQSFKESFADTPLVLLTSFSHEISRRLLSEDTSCIDYVFSWQGNAELLLAIIKMIEDSRNAERDMLEFGVQGILLVEDSIRFYSAYLPDLYKIVLTQTNISITEALNEYQRKSRKRARPKILFARTYDEAIEIFDKFRHNLLGVISDVSYARHRGDTKLERMAGIELCSHIHYLDSRMPLLLQSSEMVMEEEATKVGADFIYKHSKTLFNEMEEFINKRLAFGEFNFTDPTSGKVLAIASDLASLQNAIETLPDEVLLYYSGRNIYSKWLYARGLGQLADEIRGVFVENFAGASELRTFLSNVIKSYRRAMGQGVIAEFNPATYSRYITFARCGTGSLGGKARGLAFVGSIIEKNNLYKAWEGVLVTIPRTLAIGTGYFDEFIEENGLGFITAEADLMDDNEILSEFISSRLPEKLLDEIRVFLSEIQRPIAVRSSSKLEDSHYQPFAGIYSTYMVPRSNNLDREVRMVARAIKSVYASVYFSASRAYIESTSNVIGEESMSVVIQEICGTEQDGLFFPTFSGVARSVNYYPIGDEKPEEGICDLAMGLGKAVVEGGARLRFSPAHPRHTLQLSTMETTLRDTQRYFYALNTSSAAFRTSVDDGINLERIEVSSAKKFRNLKYIASTWDMANERISDSFSPNGRHLITFASILKYNKFPLAEIVTTLLKIGEQAMKSPIEIEFAVNMDVEKGEPIIFNFLQIRPIATTCRGTSLDWSAVNIEKPILYAQKALGVGAIENVRTIVYVRSENFDASQTTRIADEIGEINERLKSENNSYVLVGPGRWGSSDSWLGIPVKWAQINGSKAIVECGLPDFQIDPSQGTHFFQNLTSLGVGYLTINPFNGDGEFNKEYLDSLDATYQSEMLRVVEFKEPLYIFVDGKNNKAIISIDNS